MTPSFLFHTNKPTARTTVKLIALGLALVFCVGLICSAVTAWYIRQVGTALRDQQMAVASQNAAAALPWLQPLRWLTFFSVPDVEIANTGLHILVELKEADTLITNLKQLNDVDLTAPQLDTVQLRTHLTTLQTLIPQSWLLRSKQDQLSQVLAGGQDLLTVYEHLKSGPKTILVVFQNSDELRATGGFMGSFAKVELKDGLIHALTIEDIYQPDGQFTGYVAAPPGVAEYLSSGNGLRLPDSNWFPDFPTSAQTILSYFALGTEQSSTGVIAISSSLVTSLLKLTGPLTLPDSDTIVTADNFTQVARSDRASFFPGSRQKSIFLRSFFTQFKLALADLATQNPLALIEIGQNAGTSKDIQIFMLDDTLQTIAQQYQFAGTIAIPPATDEYLFLVESNVGINKVNPLVTRAVEVAIADYQLTVKVEFTNQSAQDQYINYQRLLVPPTVELHKAVYNHQDIPLTTIHSHQLLTSNQTELNQYGLLVELPAKSQRTLELAFTTNHYYQNSAPTLFIQKQAGLGAVPYTVTFQGNQQQLLLEKDTILKLNI